MFQQIGKDKQRGLLALLITSLVVLLISTPAIVPSRAQSDDAPTPTPAATLAATSTPQPLRFAEATRQIFSELDYGKDGSFELNSIGVDARDNIYVPYRENQIIVYTPDFREIRRFNIPQTVALAFTLNHDQLLLGLRVPPSIERYDTRGKKLGVLWATQNALIQALAVDPQNGIYVVYTSQNKPFPLFLTRLDANGNILYERTLREQTLLTDKVYGITFEPDGTVNIGVSGFGRQYPEQITLWRLSPEGDRLTDQQRSFFFFVSLTAPALPLRLDDGTLLLYSNEGLGWWRPDAQLITYYYGGDLFAGASPRTEGKHAAITLGIDGKTLYFASILREGELLLGKTVLGR
ncbi:MAG: hypothetical protein KF726_24690 [Anaerolineae bacterium]|nr:hypothetical protein [Anaerolineae bacterium]